MNDTGDMTTESGGREVLLLDCCSLLNLYATRHLPDMIRGLPHRFVVADAVVAEGIYVLKGGSGDDAGEREPVDLGPLIDDGLITTWSLETEGEYTSLVNFAVEIDDGEAAICALALHRGGAVVTDDGKTLKVLPRLAPGVKVLTTSQVIRLWTELARVSRATVRNALLDIQFRANFVCGKRDPLFAWWNDLIRARA
jgi:hypothetical protein